MKSLLFSTAIAALVAGPALADGHAQKMNDPFVSASTMEPGMGAELMASELIGKRVYTAERDVTETAMSEIGDDSL